MFVVYLIIRDDDLMYIGKTSTKNLKYRIRNHLKSKRFVDHQIKEYKILYQSDNHKDILDKETYYINEYDTFKNGLNKTKDGKGKHNNSYRFTTLGFKLSEETKRKIGEKSKLKKPTMLGKHHSEETKKLLSNIRKGKVSYIKFSSKEIEQLLNLYISKPFLGEINKIQGNGKKLTYERLFSKTYSKEFNITSNNIHKIITGKTMAWKMLYEKIVNLKS